MIQNAYGQEINFQAVVNLMDDEIREELHNKMAPCTDQEFFNAYCASHLDVFGEEFEPNKENGVW